MTTARPKEVTCWNTFFNNPKDGENECASFASRVDNLDKAFKFGVAVGKIVDATVDLTNASDYWKNGLKNTTGGLEVTRGFISFTNAVRGAVPGCISNVQNVVSLVQKDAPSYYNNNVKGMVQPQGLAQKILAGASEVGSFVGSATYAGAFAFLSPIRLFEKFFGRINASLSSIGKQFNLVMMINHFGVITALICDMVRETMVDWGKSTYEYAKRMANLILSFLVKACEIGVDVVKVIGVKAPLALVLILNAVGAGIQVYQVYQSNHTAVQKAVDKAAGR